MYVRFVFQEFIAGLRSEYRNFSIRSRQARLAFVAALSSVLAYLGAYMLHLDMPEWAAISALIVSQSSVGASLSKGILRVTGTLIGALLTLVLVSLFADDPWVLLFCIFACSFLVPFGIAMRPSQQYGWTIGGFLVVALLTVALNSPEKIFEMCVYRTMEISLGSIIAAICSLFLGSRARTDLSGNFISLWQGMDKAFAKGMEGLARQQSTEVLDILGTLRKNLDRLPKLLQEARTEGSLTLAQFGNYDFLLRRSRAICRWMFQFFSHSSKHPDRLPAAFGKELGNVAGAFSALSQAIQSAVQSGTLSLGTDALVRSRVGELDKATAQLIQAYETYLEEKQSSDYFEHLKFNYLARLLRRIHESLTDLDGEENNILADTYSAPDVRMALSLGLAMGLAMVTVPLLWMWFDLPNPMGASIAAFLVMRPDSVATWQRALLRISGCFLGGVSALIVIGLPLAHSFFPWLALIFFFLFCAMYINYGQARSSYAGLQASLAMAVTFFHSYGPATYLEPPLSRLAAIFIGIAVSNVIANLLYPFQPERELWKLLCRLGAGMAPLLNLLTEKQGQSKDTDLLLALRARWSDAPGLLRLASATRQLSASELATFGGSMENVRIALDQLHGLFEEGYPSVLAARAYSTGLQDVLDATAKAMQRAFGNSKPRTYELVEFTASVRHARRKLATELPRLRQSLRTVLAATRPQKMEAASWGVRLSCLLEELETLAVRLEALAGCWDAGDFYYGVTEDVSHAGEDAGEPESRKH